MCACVCVHALAVAAQIPQERDLPAASLHVLAGGAPLVEAGGGGVGNRHPRVEAAPELLARPGVWPELDVSFELQPRIFPGGPRSLDRRLSPGRVPSSWRSWQHLRDKGLEETKEFSWEVCFSSVGISGPGASALELAEGSDLKQRDAAILSKVPRDPVSNLLMR